VRKAAPGGHSDRASKEGGEQKGWLKKEGLVGWIFIEGGGGILRRKGRPEKTFRRGPGNNLKKGNSRIEVYCREAFAEVDEMRLCCLNE